MAASTPPGSLQVHTRWKAPDDGLGPALVFATEPRRRRIGMWAPLPVVLVALLAWGLGVPGAFAATLVGGSFLVAAIYGLGGAAGYYEVSGEGRLTYLGWQVPDLTGRRRTRVGAQELLRTS